jgi:hypothetical protein
MTEFWILFYAYFPYHGFAFENEISFCTELFNSMNFDPSIRIRANVMRVFHEQKVVPYQNSHIYNYGFQIKICHEQKDHNVANSYKSIPII